jgi:hypothetical protein
MNAGILDSYIRDIDYISPLNLLTEYKFEESSGNAIDSIGNYDGVTNNIQYSQTGKKGNCFGFTKYDHVNNYYSHIKSMPSYELITEGTFSFCGWFNPTTIASGNYSHRLFTIFKGASTSVLFICFDNLDKLAYFDGGSRTEITTVQKNVWTHIAVCYDGSTAHIYKNGQLVASITHTLQVASANEVQVSRYASGLEGRMDEVKFSKTCWSAENVNNIYIYE